LPPNEHIRSRSRFIARLFELSLLKLRELNQPIDRQALRERRPTGGDDLNESQAVKKITSRSHQSTRVILAEIPVNPQHCVTTSPASQTNHPLPHLPVSGVYQILPKSSMFLEEGTSNYNSRELKWIA
jgi:hypothetical protein